MFLALLLTNLNTTATEAVAEVLPAGEEMSFSLIGMAAKGGWLMLVLLALSIIAIYIFGQNGG